MVETEAQKKTTEVQGLELKGEPPGADRVLPGTAGCVAAHLLTPFSPKVP